MPREDDRDSVGAAWSSTEGGRAQLSRRAFVVGGALLTAAGCTDRASRRSVATTAPGAAEPTAPAVGRTIERAPAVGPTPARTATTTPGAGTTGPAYEVMRGTALRAEVALTFHGAGEPALATSILATARTAHAPITVMAVGTWLNANRSIASRILADGNELGNHTWTHPVLRDLGRSAARIEIERCRDELVRLTGSPGRWFRQSGSQHSTALIRELAGAAGYPVCLSYDLDSLDWTDPGPAAIVRNVAAARPGSIVSMHLGHQGTLRALPEVLRTLARRGLHAVTVTELLAA